MTSNETWERLANDAFAHGSDIDIEGYLTVADIEPLHSYFLLTPNASCCAGCIPRQSEACIEVFTRAPMPASAARMRFTGTLVCLVDDPLGWRFQLSDARLSDQQPEPNPLDADESVQQALRDPSRDMVPGLFTRRGFLSASAFLGLAACASPAPPPMTSKSGKATSPRAIMDQGITVDMHSHAGRVIPLRNTQSPLLADDRPFVPLADPMRQGGLAVVCLAVVADTPVTRIEGTRIQAVRDPQPGELYTWSTMAFDRVHRLIDGQGMGTITDVSSLRRSDDAAPGAIVACEGADFLEGQIDRVDEAYERHQLRHMQLVHYRINELGDIQTEPEQYGGLTDFGVAVIKRCNDRGIVVDVAHGPFDLVKRAAEVTSRPLVLSHTSLSPNPGPRSRLISPDHARLVAGTGGVIGIWPPSTRFPDVHAMALGMAQMVDVVGVDHVGLGTDMLGLTSPSVLPGYADLPLLVSALIDVGFNIEEISKIMGGNYVRVFEKTAGHFFD